MALTKDQKKQVIDEVAALLADSKLTVIAKYEGTSVKQLQTLRKEAKASSTRVKVIKNRLVKQAIANNDKLKAIDTSNINGQLLYAFNVEDEVAPAQNLAKFAKTNPTIEFVGAISKDGQLMSVEDVKVLANLPSKDQLRGQLVGTIAAPLSGFVGVMNANIRSLATVLQARADSIS